MGLHSSTRTMIWSKSPIILKVKTLFKPLLLNFNINKKEYYKILRKILRDIERTVLLLQKPDSIILPNNMLETVKEY